MNTIVIGGRKVILLPPSGKCLSLAEVNSSLLSKRLRNACRCPHRTEINLNSLCSIPEGCRIVTDRGAVITKINGISLAFKKAMAPKTRKRIIAFFHDLIESSETSLVNERCRNYRDCKSMFESMRMDDFCDMSIPGEEDFCSFSCLGCPKFGEGGNNVNT